MLPTIYSFLTMHVTWSGVLVQGDSCDRLHGAACMDLTCPVTTLSILIIGGFFSLFFWIMYGGECIIWCQEFIAGSTGI